MGASFVTSFKLFIWINKLFLDANRFKFCCSNVILDIVDFEIINCVTVRKLKNKLFLNCLIGFTIGEES